MGIIKFRNLRYIYCNKIKIALTFIVLFLFSLTNANAQISNHNYNYIDFQQKPFYFGLSLGFNGSGYDIRRSKSFIKNDSIFTAESPTKPGFIVHMIGNLKIGEYFDLRFLPGFSFTTRELKYSGAAGDVYSSKAIESVFFEIPFLLRYKSVPYKDKRAFVVAGMKYSYDVQSNSQINNREEFVRISPHDFQFEIGVGVQFFLPYFIFSPEFKFSQGISNTHLYNATLNESLVLDNIYSRTFTISFNFEG